jgi:hypothetical protein
MYQKREALGESFGLYWGISKFMPSAVPKSMTAGHIFPHLALTQETLLQHTNYQSRALTMDAVHFHSGIGV